MKESNNIGEMVVADLRCSHTMSPSLVSLFVGDTTLSPHANTKGVGGGFVWAAEWLVPLDSNPQSKTIGEQN